MSSPTPPGVLSDSETEGPLSSAPTARSRRVFLVAGGIAAVWILGLIVLALTTANPVTLNRRQILRSDFVVTAIRENPTSDTLTVSTEWKRGEGLGEISVANLDEAKMPACREFLVPLVQVAPGRYLITKTALPNEAPLIYPATEEATSQLAAILEASDE